jgi:hypothetical protein
MMTRFPSAAFFALAALLAIAGCAKHSTRTANFGSAEDVLSYGVYRATTLDSGYSTTLSLNQNGTYSKKKFLGSCFVVENKGTWSGDNESIQFDLKEIRRRPGCDTESWQSEKVGKSARRHIRSLSPKSFDLLDHDEESSDSWVKFVKR